MFKGKIHLYKNVGGKEEEMSKEFNDEKEFNEFIDKNPEFKKMRGFNWARMARWPSLSMFGNRYRKMKQLENGFIKDMEKDFEKMEKEVKSLFGKSKKKLLK